jgi:siroheme synthase-like protein
VWASSGDENDKESVVSAYPLFLRLEGRSVLVVGGGPVAVEKAKALVSAGARVRVVAPEVDVALGELFGSDVEQRAFRPSDVDDAWLVVAAAPPEVNRAVRAAADARRVFVVAVDDVEHCSAIGAAAFERGGITVALSSDGRAPALVALLRRALDSLLPADLAAWSRIAAEARPAWKAAGVPIAERRPLLLRALVALYARESREAA